MANIQEKSVYISREEKNGVTQELIKSIFDYHEVGYLIWKVKTSYKSQINIGNKAGNIKTDRKKIKRVVITVNRNSYFGSRLIFLYHHGWLPKVIDHRDRNSLNDREWNLRAASQADNCKNRTSRKYSSSKYLGVSWINPRKCGALK